jgi:hypothetical protein
MKLAVVAVLISVVALPACADGQPWPSRDEARSQLTDELYRPAPRQSAAQFERIPDQRVVRAVVPSTIPSVPPLPQYEQPRPRTTRAVSSNEPMADLTDRQLRILNTLTLMDVADSLEDLKIRR